MRGALVIATIAGVVSAAAPASGAHARSATAATGKTKKRQLHQARISHSRRDRKIASRVMNLRFIRSLQGKRKTIRLGLTDYAAVRDRGRELKAKLGDRMTITSMIKTKSFVLDRFDFRVPSRHKKPRVLIIGGIHAGSEPVGVETAMQFAEGLAKKSSLLEKYDITVVPLANPKGLMRTPDTVSQSGTPGRYTTDGIDLNRSFAPGQWVPESRAIARLIDTGGYDAVYDLHSAGTFRTGFFAIRGGSDGGHAKTFMRRLSDHFPVLDRKGAGKVYTLDAPGVVTSSNPGTLKQYAIDRGVRHAYTFEAPGRLAGAQQVAGQHMMVRLALRDLSSRLRR